MTTIKSRTRWAGALVLLVGAAMKSRTRWAGALVLLVSAAMGCERRVEGAAGSAAAQAGATAGQVEGLLARPMPERLVVVGDLHGDLAAARAALRAAGAVDAADRWIGGALVVVQTGDVIDRGDDDRALLDWLELVAGRAQAAGGALVRLNGNHELMMAFGDFRYVSEAGWRAFADVPVPATLASAVAELPEMARGRVAAFAPGGPYARRLAQQDVIALVGDTVLVHGGILPEHVRRGLGRINREVRAWLDGKAAEPRAITRDERSPAWTRVWATGEPDCAALAKLLAEVPAKRLVVGHTTQKDGVREACAGALWFVDVGLSKVYGGPIEVLELRRGEGGAVSGKVLRGVRAG